MIIPTHGQVLYLGIMRKHKITFSYSLVQNIPFSKMKNTDVKCGTSSALFDTTLL